MDANLIPTAETLAAMHPYMGLPREVREFAIRRILSAAPYVGGEHSRDAQVASLALRAFEAGYRLAAHGSVSSHESIGTGR